MKDYQHKWGDFENSDEIEDLKHREAVEEFQFYRAVARGEIEEVEANCRKGSFSEMDKMGVLSRNPVTNLKYHFVISTAMVTRLCHKGGMELEQAYRLSDFYIRQLDDINTVDGIRSLHDEMTLDFTRKMRNYRAADTNSRHVNACKEFVYAHLKERITVEMLAENLQISPSHLSRLFRNETGIALGDYIRSQKIEAAKNLLRYSDYSIIEIANRLAFSSQSHFIQSFRSAVGVTPKKYRDAYYTADWDVDGEEH